MLLVPVRDVSLDESSPQEDKISLDSPTQEWMLFAGKGACGQA